jgi:hypothetical protein
MMVRSFGSIDELWGCLEAARKLADTLEAGGKLADIREAGKLPRS